jgi:hypothetical protein
MKTLVNLFVELLRETAIKNDLEDKLEREDMSSLLAKKTRNPLSPRSVNQIEKYLSLATITQRLAVNLSTM